MDDLNNQKIKYSNKEISHLLWTGGWDSTFRLLQLLLKENKIVRAHYLIRPQECTGKEINTIHDIRRMLLKQYPETKDLFLPIEFANIGKVEKDNSITEEYEQIKQTIFISSQYEMFARYCKQNHLYNLEIGIEKDSHSHGLIKDYITRCNNSNFKIDKEKSPESFYKIFKYFRFPLLEYNKLDMQAIAKKDNWMQIMKMTWFCRRPKNNRPCGFCGPCTDVLIDGLGWRLPLRSRIIANIQLPFRKWWRSNYKKQSKGILKYIPQLLKGKF